MPARVRVTSHCFTLFQNTDHGVVEFYRGSACVKIAIKQTPWPTTR